MYKALYGSASIAKYKIPYFAYIFHSAWLTMPFKLVALLCFFILLVFHFTLIIAFSVLGVRENSLFPRYVFRSLTLSQYIFPSPIVEARLASKLPRNFSCTHIFQMTIVNFQLFCALFLTRVPPTIPATFSLLI